MVGFQVRPLRTGCTVFRPLCPTLNLQHTDRRIVFENGFWWFCDERDGRKENMRLYLQSCGWTVSDLCESLGIPERTFRRIVEESLGISAKRWLRELRAVKACHLLLDLPAVDDVARELGFSHVAGFSREFSKIIGQSPSKFIQQRIRY